MLDEAKSVGKGVLCTGAGKDGFKDVDGDGAGRCSAVILLAVEDGRNDEDSGAFVLSAKIAVRDVDGIGLFASSVSSRALFHPMRHSLSPSERPSPALRRLCVGSCEGSLDLFHDGTSFPA